MSSPLIDRLRTCGADIDAALERLVGDEVLYESCLRMFLEDPSFPELKAALDCGDYSAAFTAAHTIKGVAGNLGLTPVFTAADALVTPLRHGRPRNADLPTLYETLMSAMADIRSLL